MTGAYYGLEHDNFAITFAAYLVIVIPWVVRLYVEIIHELKRRDYLTYR